VWGLAAVYGSRSVPASVRIRIDRVFGDEGGLRSRVIGRGESTAARGRADEAPMLPIEAGFDAFVANNVQVLQDLGSLYAGIAYLRELDGEKHIVFVTENGFLLPRVEDDNDLVRAASDARVAIDIVQTGGVAIGFSALLSRAMRAIANDTGGMAAIAEYSAPALERLDAATRAGYLLGYYPSDPKLDGRFRRIQVKVNRRDALVLFRTGYYAREAMPAFTRRGFAVHNRLIGTAVYRGELHDIGVKVQATVAKSRDGDQFVAQVLVDPSKLYFTIENGRRVGRIDIAQFELNRDGRIVREGWQTADLNFSEATFQSVAKNWIAYKVRLPADPAARTLVVAVYDYMADLVGSTRVKVR
jgi:hypothetical protein